MKKLIVFLVSVFAGYTVAGSIHTWTSGEYINSTDLNAALTHLHNNLGHGHGPILNNSDVSTSAAIAHSKLATPALLPKAWVSLTTLCVTSGAGAACASVDSSGTAVVTSTGVTNGEYTVTFPTRGSALYGTLVSPFGADDLQCHTVAQAATTANVKCFVASTGAAVDAAFTFLILDT